MQPLNDVEKSVFFLGRVLVGFFFLIMGMNHFGNLGDISATVAAEGVPAPTIAVLVTGILLVFAGLSFILGFHPTMGVLAIAIFMVPVTLVMHNFWTITDPMERQQEMMLLLRNMALLGAVMVFVAVPRPWAMSIDGYLARRRRDKESGEDEAEDFDDLDDLEGVMA